MPHQSQDRSPREVELKLAIPDSSADALEAHLWARAAGAGGAQRRHEVTTYFDFGRRMLHRGGVSLRVRAAGERRIQTLKGIVRTASPRIGGMEWPVEQDKPDLRVARQVLEKLGLPHTLDLEPVFRTEVDRTTRILNLDGGTVIEMACDKGLIAAGDRHQPIRELELELRDGEAASLYRLACELHAAAPLMLEPESKGARGYRLSKNAKP